VSSFRTLSPTTHRHQLFLNRWYFLWGACALVVVDLIGLCAPLLTKAVIQRIESQTLPFWIPQSIGSLNPESFLIALISLFIGLNAIAFIGRYAWRAAMVWKVFPNIRELRQNLFSHLLSLDWQSLRRRKIGDLIAAISEDVENLRMTVSLGTLAVTDTIISFILLPLVLYYVAPQLTLLIFPPLVVLVILLVILSDRWRALYQKVQDQQGELSAKAFELAAGLRVIKAFGREQAMGDDFHKESQKLYMLQGAVSPYQAGFNPLMRLILGGAYLAALIVGSKLVMSGELSLGGFAAFVLYLGNLEWPLTAMAWFVDLYRRSRASQGRLQAVMELHSDFASAPVDVSEKIQEVRVQWVNSESKTEWRLCPAERWAISGPVGSGKSLLLESLARLRKSPSLSITINHSQNLDGISDEEWQKRCLYLPQEAFIFTKSLRANVLLGELCTTDEDLWALLDALKIRRAEWEARGALLTRLGERGMNLSGGQRQRISIARSLVRKRELYLFDDVLSHLDPETEQSVLNLILSKLPRDSIVVFGSQRWSVLERFERHLVLEPRQSGAQSPGGMGSKEDALKKSSYLRRLRELQAA
jgi:ATP-binding cassette, subfamily B, multidrug efflux pump